jgi:murein biosynthesis integral membrane protein MurJ
MSQTVDDDTSPRSAIGTTSARLVAVRLKSANKNIFRALLSLSSATLLIRLMGLINTIIVTARFGQGSVMDAYFVATTVPTLLGSLLTSALEGSVIPVYAPMRTQAGREKASRFFSTLLNLLIVGSILLTVAIFMFRQQLLYISAPGTSADVLANTIALAPLVFPVLGFMVLYSYIECLLNAEGQFGWPAYAGALVPLVTVVFVLLLGRQDGVFAIGVGTLVGQAVQLCAVLIRARRAKIRYLPIIDFRMSEIKTVAFLAWPALLGGVIGCASPFVDQIFASYQTAGTIAAINNALKINSAISGIIFSAAARAALPFLSAQVGRKDMKAFKETLRLYLWGVAVVTLGCSLVLILFAQPIVALLFQHGAFNAQDAHLTAITLQGFAIGLTPMAIGFILAKAFSALRKPKFLTFVTIFNVVANAIFDGIFGTLWHSFGIAFATSLYYFCSMFVLIIGLRVFIGKLDLLKSPPELPRAIWAFCLEPFYIKWLAWREDNPIMEEISWQEFYQQVARWFMIVVVFAAGIYGSAVNGLLTVRIALGSLVVLALLRYQYLLLLSWAILNVFIGSSLPFFDGGHLLSGLTIPTFLLLFYLPTRVALKRMVALPFLLVFILWVLFSFWYSPISLSDFFTSWSILLDFFLVSVVVVLVIDSHKRLLCFIDATLLSAIIVAVYGIWGYVTRRVGILDPTTGNFRLTSLFPTSPPGLSVYFSIFIPITVYRILTVQGLKKLAGIAILLLFLVTIALSFTRGPLVIIPLSGIMIIPFLPSRHLKAMMICAYLIGGVAVILGATMLNLDIFRRFFDSDLTTLNGRTYLWQALLAHFDPTRLQGYGYQASNVLLATLQVGFLGGVIATVAHNIFLEVMYDQGLIGLALLIFFLAVLGVSLVHKWVTTKNAHYRLFLALALWTFLSVVIQCNETDDIWNARIGIYFFAIMALPFAVCWIKEEKP